jgi:hypothetical protein
MKANDGGIDGLLTAGGVLSILAGAFEVIGGGIMVALVSLGIPFRLAFLPFRPEGWFERVLPAIPICLIIVGALLLVLGIIAIVGGISAIRRRSFGLSLAGAICALPAKILGILAVIFVSLSKREFEAEN